MKRSSVVAILFVLNGSAMLADENTDRAAQLENTGDAAGARAVLVKAVEAAPTNPGTLGAYASFLERYGDPEARAVYRKLFAESNRSGDKAHAQEAARRLVILDLR